VISNVRRLFEVTLIGHPQHADVKLRVPRTEDEFPSLTASAVRNGYTGLRTTQVEPTQPPAPRSGATFRSVLVDLSALYTGARERGDAVMTRRYANAISILIGETCVEPTINPQQLGAADTLPKGSDQ
jgi:hypothetical protein